ncbi:ribonuclease domain-containing protein [Rhodoferax sp.]|uniref:ribonuclease domain-containing protein n=1 Tax=Rhodoferax sp. TaxID=50421 RepID=UPI00374D332C
MVANVSPIYRRRLVATLVWAASVLCTPLGYAFQPIQPSNLQAIRVVELPTQGRATYQLIQQGGPFPFAKDGVVFGNRERILPSRQRGYYREYTVKTAGAGNRGAQRIVCGGRPTTPDACFYTSDHYASFRQIVD